MSLWGPFLFTRFPYFGLNVCPAPDPRKSTVEVLTAKEMELEVEPLEGKDII